MTETKDTPKICERALLVGAYIDAAEKQGLCAVGVAQALLADAHLRAAHLVAIAERLAASDVRAVAIA